MRDLTSGMICVIVGGFSYSSDWLHSDYSPVAI
jgi:hypothetical protein